MVKGDICTNDETGFGNTSHYVSSAKQGLFLSCASRPCTAADPKRATPTVSGTTPASASTIMILLPCVPVSLGRPKGIYTAHPNTFLSHYLIPIYARAGSALAQPPGGYYLAVDVCVSRAFICSARCAIPFSNKLLWQGRPHAPCIQKHSYLA